ncbi:hypothetical protein ACFLIN_07750 [Corynebacterium kutscheri]
MTSPLYDFWLLELHTPGLGSEDVWAFAVALPDSNMVATMAMVVSFR